MVDQSDPITLADAEGGRGPFADPVQGQDGRPVERAWEERAGGVALVMVGEDQAGAARSIQAIAQGPPHVQLVLEPERHGPAKAAKPAGRIGQIGLEQPFEFGEGLVVERDVIQVARRKPGLPQTIAGRLGRECRIMLDPGESLFLGRTDDPAVDHQRRRAVVVKRGDPQNRGHTSTPLSARFPPRHPAGAHSAHIITEGRRGFPCRPEMAKSRPGL